MNYGCHRPPVFMVMNSHVSPIARRVHGEHRSNHDVSTKTSVTHAMADYKIENKILALGS